MVLWRNKRLQVIGLRRVGRNVAVGSNGYPLRENSGCVGIEVKELLLVVQLFFTSRLFWRFVKAAILFRLNLFLAQLAFEPKVLRETDYAAPVYSSDFCYPVYCLGEV